MGPKPPKVDKIPDNEQKGKLRSQRASDNKGSSKSQPPKARPTQRPPTPALVNAEGDPGNMEQPQFISTPNAVTLSPKPQCKGPNKLSRPSSIPTQLHTGGIKIV